jgi:cell division protein FtsL
MNRKSPKGAQKPAKKPALKTKTRRVILRGEKIFTILLAVFVLLTQLPALSLASEKTGGGGVAN